MTTTRHNWSYVSGLVSAQAERLLDDREITALLDIPDEEERRARLRASLLFAEGPPEGDPSDAVEAAFAACVEGIALASPNPAVADLFTAAADWEEFRAFAKSKMSDGDPTLRDTRDKDAGPLRFEAVWQDRAEDSRLEPFAAAAARIQAECPGEGDRAGWIDLVTDAYEAAALDRTAARLGAGGLACWIRTWTTLRAAVGFVRARRAQWETAPILEIWRSVGFDDSILADVAKGPENNWPAAFDKLGLPAAHDVLGGDSKDAAVRLAVAVDRRLSELASAANGIPFGPERVFAFLWQLRNEAINLRLALAAAKYGMPVARVEAELR